MDDYDGGPTYDRAEYERLTEEYHARIAGYTSTPADQAGAFIALLFWIGFVAVFGIAILKAVF